MINVEIYRSSDKNITKYLVYGHARYAIRGLDILCAAVSTIVQSAALGLSKVAGVAVGIDVMGDDDDVYTDLSKLQMAGLLLQSILRQFGELICLPWTKDGQQELEDADAIFECILPEYLDITAREKANVILETMLISLRNLEQKYKKYLSVVEVEV